MPLPSLPFRMSGVDQWLRRPAPTLGRDNGTVLRDFLGLSTEEIDALEASSVIAQHPVER